jgi:hypothetical protein
MLLWPTAPLGAQAASPYLPLDHWAYGALSRLDGLGLLEGFDPVSRAVRVLDALRHFEAAVAGAEPPLVSLTRGYRDRLAAETGASGRGTGPSETEEALWSSAVFATGRAHLAYGAQGGRVEPGVGGYWPADWSGPRPVPVASEPRARVGGGVGVGPVAGHATVRVAGWTATLEEAYGLIDMGPAGLWLGRRPWGYRGGFGGGLVLDSVRVDGGGLIVRAMDIGLLGDVAIETTVSRVSDNGWIGRPWLWSLRAAIEPHRRFGLGITRAAMFGGDRNVPVTLDKALKVFLGKHAAPGSGFENQIAAIDVWFRPPVPVPTVLRLEWGFEDSGGAITEQPGIVAGLEVPAVPGLPEVAVGIEYARVSGESLGHWFWYRHWWFHGGWTDDGNDLGHPLGGHGQELRLQGRADLVRPAVQLRGELFGRDRGEYNIFAPDREGRSLGMLMELDWRFMRHLELTGGVSWEESEAGWRERSGRIGIRWTGGVGGP